MTSTRLMRPLPTVIRVCAGLTGAAAVPMATYSGWLALTGAVAAGASERVYRTLLAVNGLVAAVLAVTVAFRARPGRATAQFSVFFAGFALAGMDDGRLRLLDRLLGDALPWEEWLLTGVFFAAVTAGAAASVRIPQLFPRPLTAAAIRAADGPRWLRRLQARLLGPLPAWLGFGVGGWFTLMVVMRWLPGLVIPATLLYLIVELTAAILYLRVAYAGGGEEDRRRIYWFLEAGLIAAGALAVGFWVELAVHVLDLDGIAVRWLHAVVIPLGFLATVLTLGIAILYKGALDSRLVVRRTLLYGGLGFVLTALFVGVETLVEEALSARMGRPDRAGAYVAGVIAAIVFGPVRAAMEKRMPR